MEDMAHDNPHATEQGSSQTVCGSELPGEGVLGHTHMAEHHQPTPPSF